MYGQNKFDDNLGDGKYLENKLAYLTWNWGHLTLQPAADTTHAKSLTGITLVDGQICESLGDGGTSSALTTLPAATYGGLTVFRHVAQADGAEDHVISCASDETFKVGSMNFQIEGQEVLHLMSPVYTSVWTPSVAIGAGSVEAIAEGNNTITQNLTATNNQSNIGAEWAFFCEKAGVWSVAFRGSELGSGILGTGLAFSTV